MRVRRAARALTDAYDDALKPLGLKVTQFSLLRTVARMETPSLTALAQEMALDRSTLGRNVGVLQREGLVELSEGNDFRGHARLAYLSCDREARARPTEQRGVDAMLDRLRRTQATRLRWRFREVFAWSISQPPDARAAER